MTTNWTIHKNPKSFTINDDQGHILARINRSDVQNAEAIACLMADAPQQKETINKLKGQNIELRTIATKLADAMGRKSSNLFPLTDEEKSILALALLDLGVRMEPETFLSYMKLARKLGIMEKIEEISRDRCDPNLPTPDRPPPPPTSTTH